MVVRDSLSARPLAEPDLQATSRMLADAFEVDPAYRYLIPDAAARPSGLEDFFARNLRVHLPFRCSHAAFEGGRLVGTVTLRPVGGVHVSSLTLLRHGLLPLLLRHGREAVRRLVWLKRTYDALEHELAAGQPYRHVHMMAVSPQMQGRGVGGELLTQVLGDARPSGTSPAPSTVLTTHLPRNLVFYRRAGFEVTLERTLHPPRAEPYTVWGMRLSGAA